MLGRMLPTRAHVVLHTDLLPTHLLEANSCDPKPTTISDADSFEKSNCSCHFLLRYISLFPGAYEFNILEVPKKIEP